MANHVSFEYIDLNGKKRMLQCNCELIDIYADVREETEDSIIMENCSVRIENKIYMKISKAWEKKLGFQLSYGIVGFDNFVKMIQQMLRTNKKLIFTDIYSDDEQYCKEITI